MADYAERNNSKDNVNHPIVWKTIAGFPNYEISNHLEVRNKTTGQQRKFSNGKRGYLVISLFHDGKMYLKPVHRLVAEAFIPNPEGKPQVNHIDGNKLNNNIDNLEWVTSKENLLHARRTGLHTSDGDIPVKQLDMDGNIIAVYKSMSEASRKTGANRSAIGKVVRKETRYKTAGGYRWEYAE